MYTIYIDFGLYKLMTQCFTGPARASFFCLGQFLLAFQQLKWQLKCRRQMVKNIKFRASRVSEWIHMYFERSAKAWDSHLLVFFLFVCF